MSIQNPFMKIVNTNKRTQLSIQSHKLFHWSLHLSSSYNFQGLALYVVIKTYHKNADFNTFYKI